MSTSYPKSTLLQAAPIPGATTVHNPLLKTGLTRNLAQYLLKISLLMLLAVSGLKGWGQNASATWGANGNTAWYTPGNWTGGAYAGVQGTATSNSNIATFTSAFTGTTPGINMGTASLNLGAVSIDNTRTTALNIGNSSGTAGVLRLYGTTVNSVANVIIRNNGTGLLTLQAAQSGTMGVPLGSTTNNIINIDNTGGVTISSIISSVSGTTPLTKAGGGTGVLTLSGANTYSGSTTITSGTLRLGVANAIPVAATGGGVILSGGTLSTGLTTGFSDGASGSTNMGTLTLTANSAIALGTGSHSIFFAASNGVSWTGSRTITISGWTGTAGASGTAGKIFVGSSATGLTAGQLAQISFTGFTNGTTILSTGEVVPAATPATPTTTSISPTSAVAGSGAFTLTVNGTNFISGSSTVTWGGSNRTTTFVSSTQLTAAIPGTDIASAGSATVGVTTTGAAASSNTQTFTITSAGVTPTKLAITSISPTSPVQNSTFNVTVQAQDVSNAAGNVTANTAFSITNTGGGTIGGTTTGTITAGANSTTVTGVTLSGNGTGITLTATQTSGDVLTAGTSSGFTVLASVPTVASTVVASNRTATTLDLTWASGGGARRIVVARLNATTAIPPTTGAIYSPSATGSFSGTTVTGLNNIVVFDGTGNTVSITNLSAATAYAFDVYEYNGTTSTANYAAAATSGSISTLSALPTGQASNVTFGTFLSTGLGYTIGFTAGTGSTGRIVVVRQAGAVDFVPVGGTTYTANTVFTSGTGLGTSSDNKVVFAGSGTSVAVTGLTANTVYNVAVYEYNGTGTSINYLTSSPATGSRTTLAAAPTTQPTGFTRSAVTTTGMTLSWTAASSGAAGYIVLRTTAGGTTYPSTNPVNGTSYTVGNTLGNATVEYVGSNLSAAVNSTLASNTQYSYSIFSYNGTGASSSYFTTSPLQGQPFTLATEPTQAPTSIVVSNLAATTATITVTGQNGAGVAVFIKSTTAVDFTPTDGISYTSGENAAFGSGTQFGSGNYLVLLSATSPFTVNVTGLTGATLYNIGVYTYNGLNSNSSNNFLPTAGTNTFTTLVAAPSAQPTALTFGSVTINSFTLGFTAATGNPAGYLVLRNTGSAPTGTPANGTTYTAGTNNIGGGTNTVVYAGVTPSPNIAQTSLTDGTNYFYSVYSYNGSGSSITYLTTSPLAGSQATSAVSAPTANAATDITNNSFTANWTPVTGASGGYLLDVSTSNVFSTGTLLSEGFESTTFPPTGWANTGWARSTTTADVNTGIASAVGNSNSGTLTTVAVANPASMTFYLGRSSNTTAKTLTVEVSTTSQTTGFSTVATFDHNNVPVSSYNQYTVDLSTYSTNATVFIRFNKVSTTTSPWRLDDIVVSGVSSILPAYNGKSITGQSTTSTSITGLSANTIYYYRLRAVGANSTSINSGTIDVTTTRIASSVTVSGTAPFSYEYDGNAKTPAFTATGSTATITYLYSGTGIVGTTSSAPINVGTYSVTASVAANGNFAAASSSATAFSITAAASSVTVSGTAPFSYGYDGNAKTPSFTATGSTATITYLYSGTGIVGTTSSAPINVGTYSVTASVAANGNFAAASSSATAFSITAAASSVTVSGTAPFSYGYDGNAKTPAFTATGSTATITYLYSGTGIVGTTSSAPINVGTYSVTASVAANGNFAAASSSATAFSITAAASSVTVSGTAPFSYGYDGNAKTPAFTATGSTATITYLYSGTGIVGTTSSAPINVGTYSVTASVAANGNFAAASSTAVEFSISGIPPANANFRSAGNVSFSSASFWQYDQGGNSWVTAGAPPSSSNNISISAGNIATLDIDFTVGAGKSLILESTSSFIINPAKRLEVTNNTSTIDFGGNPVTLKSDANGTGSIGQVFNKLVGTTLSGATNVTVERYIPAIPGTDKRAWRLLSVPTKGAQTIRQAWQELGDGDLGNTNLTSQFGTLITTPYAHATDSGFDKNSVANSFLKYNGTAWVGATSTKDTIGTRNPDIATSKAYFLYVRGNRTQGTNGSLTDVSPTTLRTNGELYQGPITSPTIGANKFAVIGNIYPSRVNFENLTKSANVDDVFYIWDAKKIDGVSLGVYQTFSLTGDWYPTIPGGSFSTTSPYTNIEQGQAFFVHTTDGEGTVGFTEAAKVAGSTNNGFRPATPAANRVSFTSNLYTTGASSYMADANKVVFDDQYSNAVDGKDALKMSNTGENFGISQRNKTLAIEGRQPVTDKDTIFYNMWNLQKRSYQLELKAANMNTPGLTAILQDAYTGANTVLNLGIANKVNFTVDATPASAAANRFRVVFTQTALAPLPVSFISISANRIAAGNAITWKVAAETNMAQYEVERSADGRNFAKTGTVAASAQTTYSFTDAQAMSGTAFYRIKGIGLSGDVKYSNIVKLTVGNIKPGFSISPNPAEGNMVNLQFKNQAAGNYLVSISTIIGQRLYTSTIAHTGGNSSQVLNITERLAAGTYQLEIIAPDKSRQTQSLVVKAND